MHPLKIYFSSSVGHVAALAVPANPLAQVHPETEKSAGVKLISFLFESS